MNEEPNSDQVYPLPDFDCFDRDLDLERDPEFKNIFFNNNNTEDPDNG
jgi:hypothetical protein